MVVTAAQIPGKSDWRLWMRVFCVPGFTAHTRTHAVGCPIRGAVSEEVARAMAQGAITHSKAQVAVAVTGVAGPTGGSKDKPVGTVWFGWSVGGVLTSECKQFDGDRAAVRAATVRYAVQRLVRLLDVPAE